MRLQTVEVLFSVIGCANLNEIVLDNSEDTLKH